MGDFLRTWQRGVRVLWGSYVAVLFIATHIPIPEPIAEVTSVWDKLIHMTAFCLLTILTAGAWLQRAPFRLNVWTLALGLVIYAACDELLQGPVGRTPDIADWGADAAGVGLGCLIVQLFVSSNWGSVLETSSEKTSTSLES